MKKMIVVLVVSGLLAGTAQAAVVFADDFESYADTAALLSPGAWGDDGGDASGAVLIPAPSGNPGQALFDAGTTTARHLFAPTTPSAAEPLVWEFDFWDYEEGDPLVGGSRLTGGLRTNGGGAALTGLLEMGHYNSAANHVDGAVGSGYSIRHVFVAGAPAGNGGWLRFNVDREVGAWHHFKATLTDTTATFELDLGDNGSVDDSFVVTGEFAKAWNIARFGGPSDISSSGAAGSDNWNIEVIPEPAMLALLGLGGLFLRRRRTA